MSTAALAAGERGQEGSEVGGPAEDHPVDWKGDPLTAVEDQVSPALLSHGLPHTGQQALSEARPSL